MNQHRLNYHPLELTKHGESCTFHKEDISLDQRFPASRGLPWWLSSEESAFSAGAAGDTGWIPGSGRSPGGGHGSPLHILAWRIPWTEEPGPLQPLGLQGVEHDKRLSTPAHPTLWDVRSDDLSWS